jgi:hypothetical protein
MVHESQLVRITKLYASVALKNAFALPAPLPLRSPSSMAARQLGNVRGLRKRMLNCKSYRCRADRLESGDDDLCMLFSMPFDLYRDYI